MNRATTPGKPCAALPRALAIAAAFIGAVAGAFLLLQAQPPAATAESPLTLVSNTGQTTAADGHTVYGDTYHAAQMFTTGDNGGTYAITSVTVDFHNIQNTATAVADISVTINPTRDDPPLPYSPICELDPPSTFSSSGIHTFTAPTDDLGCQILEAETEYFVEVSHQHPYQTSKNVSLKYTESTIEDASSASGWSIEDNRTNFDESLTGVRYNRWTRTANTAFRIQIKGTSNEPPTLTMQVAGAPLNDPPAYSVLGLGTLELSAAATDPEGGAIEYAWYTDHGWFSINYGTNTTWNGPAAKAEPYDVTIRVYATDERNAYTSAAVTVTVTPGPIPTTPSNLQATVSTANHVSLSWTNNHAADEITDMVIQRQEDDQWHTLLAIPKSTTSRDLGQGPPGETLKFRIQISTSTGLTVHSDVLEVTTRQGAPAPKHFYAHRPTQTTVVLSWTTVETAAEYLLEYRKQGESVWTRINGDFDHLPSTNSLRRVRTTVTGLECDTPYDFRVAARANGATTIGGHSHPSEFFGKYSTTSTATGVCPQKHVVTNLLISVEPLCATVTWTPQTGPVGTGHRVQRRTYSNDPNASTDYTTLSESLSQKHTASFLTNTVARPLPRLLDRIPDRRIPTFIHRASRHQQGQTIRRSVFVHHHLRTQRPAGPGRQRQAHPQLTVPAHPGLGRNIRPLDHRIPRRTTRLPPH